MCDSSPIGKFVDINYERKQLPMIIFNSWSFPNVQSMKALAIYATPPDLVKVWNITKDKFV